MNPQWGPPALSSDHSAEMSSSPNMNPSGPSSHDGANTPNVSTPAVAASKPVEMSERPKTGKRVGFTKPGNDTNNLDDRLRPTSGSTIGTDGLRPLSSALSSAAASPTLELDNPMNNPMPAVISPDASRNNSPAEQALRASIHQAFGAPMPQRPRPAIRKSPSRHLNPFASVEDSDEEDDADDPKKRSRREAQDRAHRLARTVGSASAPSSRRNSVEAHRTIYETAEGNPIPLLDLPTPKRRSGSGDILSDDEDLISKPLGEGTLAEAKKLVRSHTRTGNRAALSAEPDNIMSRPTTPIRDRDVDYVPQPSKYRGGIFGALLNLYNSQNAGATLPGGHAYGHQRLGSGTTTISATSTPGLTPAITPQHSPPASGTTTPNHERKRRQWYGGHSANPSNTSLAQLIGSSSMLASPAVQDNLGPEVAAKLKTTPRPGMGKRSRSGGAISSAMNRISKPRLEDEIRITVHISEVMARQRYLLKLCRALMAYGAPTHRLEEAMKMSARVLEIESQFLYIPGCMIISFDDSTTHTTEVKLVRTAQGVDLGKLRDTHACYKDVVHDRIGVEEATQRLEAIIKRPPRYNRWLLVLVYGLASVCVGPFAFDARMIDLPIAFVLGCIVGFLQLVAAPSSDLFNNVFEICAAVVTSFLARAFGSINGGNLFCFSALAQSSITLILPGYTVLCASSELQSKHIVAGSVRMVYAIIYSLFLGFGMTIGIVLFGIMDSNATSATTCSNKMATGYTYFFVPLFTLCLCIINHAKWKQIPVMVFISFVGYIVNHYSSQRFEGNTQISSTLGALAIGAMANLYSRLGSKVDNYVLDLYENRVRGWIKNARRSITGRKNEIRLSYKRAEEALPQHPSSTATSVDDHYAPRTRKVGYGLAAAAMLPAIFVQVPSGLAVSGSLVSGITSANEINGNATGSTTVSSGTDTSSLNSSAFNVSYSVIQVAIGITVGLFLSALVIYPVGKKRSGLFSF